MRNQTACRIIAALVVLTFSVTSIGWSAPSVSFNGALNPRELKLVSLAEQIDLPETIATVQNRYVAEKSGDGRPTNQPVIVHIQDAHASYEAQIRIKDILSHLTNTYDLDLIFLEGGMNKISPDLLRF